MDKEIKAVKKSNDKNMNSLIKKDIKQDKKIATAHKKAKKK